MDNDQQSSAVPPLTPGRQGGRGAAASLRLEERTSSDEAWPQCRVGNDQQGRQRLRTRALVRKYPGGDCEVTVTRRPRATQRGTRSPLRCAVETPLKERSAVQEVEDFIQSATRARATVRRLIQAGGLDHLLTLTYRENRTDARQCHADLTRLLRLIRDVLPEDYKYVAVFERQKRGAGHWHLAVAGWQQVHLLRALWRKVVGDGNIDVRSYVGRGRPGECSAKLAGYLTKYITKSISERMESAHRYRRSHNIVVDETIEESDDADLGRVAGSIITRLTGQGPRFVVATATGAECFVWACSWGGDQTDEVRPPRYSHEDEPAA